MPAQEGFGFEDEEGLLPTLDPAGKEGEPKAVGLARTASNKKSICLRVPPVVQYPGARRG